MISVSDIDLNDPSFYRGGIIPYTEGFTENRSDPNKNLYAFGIDSKYKSVMDFGGHREEYDRDILETALREMREESLDLLKNKIKRSDLYSCPAIVAEGMVEIFVPLNSASNINPIKFCHDYNIKAKAELASTGVEPEHSEIIWLFEPQVELMIKYNWPPMYPRLRSALQNMFFHHDT